MRRIFIIINKFRLYGGFNMKKKPIKILTITLGGLMLALTIILSSGVVNHSPTVISYKHSVTPQEHMPNG